VLKISVPADFQLRSFYVAKTPAKHLLQRHQEGNLRRIAARLSIPCRLKQGEWREEKEDLF